MVLTTNPANYIGWPVPAFISFLITSAKVQKIIELCKYFGHYF